MVRGGIHILSDELPTVVRGQHDTNELIKPVKSVVLTNRVVSCLALVPVLHRDKSTDHTLELWCGLTFGEIAVLNSNTLKSKCSALKVVPERQQRSRTRVHNMIVGIVSHLTMDCDGGETRTVSSGTQKTFVFCSIIKAGVVIKLLTETREIAGRVNVAGFLTDKGEAEGKSTL